MEPQLQPRFSSQWQYMQDSSYSVVYKATYTFATAEKVKYLCGKEWGSSSRTVTHHQHLLKERCACRLDETIVAFVSSGRPRTSVYTVSNESYEQYLCRELLQNLRLSMKRIPWPFNPFQRQERFVNGSCSKVESMLYTERHAQEQALYQIPLDELFT